MKSRTTKRKTTAGRALRTQLDYLTAGTVTKKFKVGLSYKIVELFSEGLYSSANKAFEELVTNAFDAGAQNVNVLLPSDPTVEGEAIVVVDDGEGINALGLEELWQIGVSQKRSREKLPRGRTQVGKFGIGKLATYVLANQLTYICKQDSKYFATTMDYTRLDQSANGEIRTNRTLKLDLRELTLPEAKSVVSPWTSNKKFNNWGLKLFGTSSPKSWTFAILSNLKDKANEIEPGRLEWILRTALPLRDDFSVRLDGKKLTPSKADKSRIKKWIIGKELKELAKPAPDDLKQRIDSAFPKSSLEYYGLYSPILGRITGYAEGYRDLLTSGKSSEVGRSYGFFVYVRGRLVNIDDEYFGIDSNLLRHGTFARFRLVIYVDKLDEELQSDREGLRDGPATRAVRNVLHAIFNALRPKIQEKIEGESPGARVARKLAGSPASVSRRPIVALARSSITGKVRPRYTLVPPLVNDAEKETFLSALEERAENPSEFISEIELTDSLSTDNVVAIYDAERSVLRINALHPFVGAFSEDYLSPKRRLPLELLAP